MTRDRKCLFCENKADTKEHVWPVWILTLLRNNRRSDLHGRIGKRPFKFSGPAPDLEIKCVCDPCNSGWMSTLETQNRPIIGPLLQDIALPLNRLEQTSIARWAVKSAMVMEASTPKRAFFYTRPEREQLRAGTLPSATFVWIGRYSGNFFVSFATTDTWDRMPDIPEATHGYVNTIIVGHLIIQVLSLHIRREYHDRTLRVTPKGGPWENRLIDIWPGAGMINWPPDFTFSDSGTLSFDLLRNRWSSGTALEPH